MLTLVAEPPADRADRPDRGTARFAIRGSGSAFAIEDGRVLTAAHCVEGEREIGLRDAEGHVTKASVARVDERLDLALLAAEAPLPERLRFTLADASPELGTPVFVYGTTALAFPALAEGVVAARAGSAFGEQMSPMMLTSIVAWHGMSGAPLLDLEHGARVVGVSLAFLDVNFTDPDRRGNLLGAAPIEEVRGFLDERVSENVSRYAAYAAAHRDDVDLGLVGARVVAGDEANPPHVALDVRSDRDATVTLTIRKGDETSLASRSRSTRGSPSGSFSTRPSASPARRSRSRAPRPACARSASRRRTRGPSSRRRSTCPSTWSTGRDPRTTIGCPSRSGPRSRSTATSRSSGRWSCRARASSGERSRACRSPRPRSIRRRATRTGGCGHHAAAASTWSSSPETSRSPPERWCFRSADRAPLRDEARTRAPGSCSLPSRR